MIQGQGLEPNIRAVFEGQLANAGPSIDKIEAVLAAGLKPAILVVHAKPEFALRNMLDRFEEEGRGASLHAMANIQSKLPEGLAAVHGAFGDRVRFDVFDRSAGFQNTVKLNGWDKLEIVSQEGSYDAIRKRLHEELERYRSAGAVSDDAYLQAIGKLPGNWPREAIREDARRPEPNASQIALPTETGRRAGAEERNQRSKGFKR